jgi:signal transduction histidine kinase
MIVLHDLGEEDEKKQEVGLLSAFASELRWGGGSLQLSVLRDNLLTLNLLTSGKDVNVSIGVVNLGALINELVLLSSSLALERQISFEVDVKDDLGQQVKGDESRIRQIVLNLFINAIKYTKSGGKVVVSLSDSDGELILHVQDTGIGIKTEDMNHLFEKFFVGENVPEEDRGLGLGLYVCKGLVDLMGGKIWVDSVEGRGTVASVSLSRSLK